MNLFNPKTLAEKYLKDRKFSLLKSCTKQLKRRHIYSLSKICPLAVRKGQNCPSGGPPGRSANDHFYDRCASGRPGNRAKAIGRPPDRPAPTREWGAFSRSTARSTGRIGWPLCTSRAHRSTVMVDRQSSLAGIFRI